MIGASNNRTRIGGVVFANLKRAFAGPLYPVHPSDAAVMDIPAFASIADLPEPADLAVVAVPAEAVPDVVEQAAAKGIGGAAIITSGFAEIGDEGARLQDRLSEVSRRTGIRLIGPNCIGFMNLHGGVMANFSMDPSAPLPRAGGAALVSQSGGFGSYIVRMALKAGLQLGWFVSTGNEADSSVAAVLRHLVEQPEVKVLMACAETLRDPDIFIAAAERALELDKPIVLLKAGRSEEAARAALSHTGSIAGSAEVLDAICRQYGVHVTYSMQDMLDLGLIFQNGRRVDGNRLAIMTTSGGAGVLLADAAGESGMTVPELPQPEQSSLRAEMPEPFYGNLANPVDTTAQIAARPSAAENVIGLLARSPSTDMLTVVTWEEATAHLQAVIDNYQASARPFVILCPGPVDFVQDAGVPIYSDPNRAMRALGAVVRQSLFRPSPAKPEGVDRGRVGRARAMLAEAAGEQVLMEHQGKRLLAEYGIPVTREELAFVAADTPSAAMAVGGPVALKVMSHALPHKSDVGGVRLGVAIANVADEASDMMIEVARKAPRAKIAGILVQQMVPARLEMTCGIKRDPVFGPMVVAGLGGVLVEIMAEVTMLRPPFDTETVRRALAELCGGRLIGGHRGLEETELDAVIAILIGLGRMAVELPEIAEVDINPVRIAGGRAVAADALVVLS